MIFNEKAKCRYKTCLDKLCCIAFIFKIVTFFLQNGVFQKMKAFSNLNCVLFLLKGRRMYPVELSKRVFDW